MPVGILNEILDGISFRQHTNVGVIDGLQDAVIMGLTVVHVQQTAWDAETP